MEDHNFVFPDFTLSGTVPIVCAARKYLGCYIFDNMAFQIKCKIMYAQVNMPRRKFCTFAVPVKIGHFK